MRFLGGGIRGKLWGSGFDNLRLAFGSSYGSSNVDIKSNFLSPLLERSSVAFGLLCSQERLQTIVVSTVTVITTTIMVIISSYFQDGSRSFCPSWSLSCQAIWHNAESFNNTLNACSGDCVV